MVSTKGRLMQKTKKMANYTVSRQREDPGITEGDRGCVNVGWSKTPCASMAAIHDLKRSLKPRQDAVAVDVGLLRVDLQKVSNKVSTAETDIARLQSTSKAQEEQVRFLTTEHGGMAAHLEDQE
ncbi:hypothetical protein NDU88_003668 [Pleurodeles waltl]|uniref:Uncharacterized protein n=1 Tax=Pleurodeles waltl TaxID=8319 RepID=A0AAV7WTQ5_PLEWA|nr:hypothetical protein NDU88_003668 [Pleurodeles waltl]